MPIVTRKSYSADGGIQIELPVSVAGMNITVGGGKIVFYGEELELSGDSTHTVLPDATYDKHVIGYIARSRKDGKVHVVIDEVVNDGVDEMYVFTSDSPFQPLHRYYIVRVPPGATTIEDQILNVNTVVAKKAVMEMTDG